MKFANEEEIRENHAKVMEYDLRQLEWDRSINDGAALPNANVWIESHNRKIVQAYEKGLDVGRKEAKIEERPRLRAYVFPRSGVETEAYYKVDDVFEYLKGDK